MPAINMFGFPRLESGEVQIVTADSAGTSQQLKSVNKPRGASMCLMFLLAGGGSGASPNPGAAVSGGGGGGAGGATLALFPAILLPDVLWVNVGRGGARVTTSNTAGSAGQPTFVYADASNATNNTIMGTGTTGGGGGAVAGTAGAAGSTGAAANQGGHGLALSTYISGVAGAAGAAGAGGAITWGGGTRTWSGGGGGAGSNGGAGGNVTGTARYPTLAGGTTGGAANAGNGADGYYLLNTSPFHFVAFGGAGGGGTTGGAGVTGGHGGNEVLDAAEGEAGIRVRAEPPATAAKAVTESPFSSGCDHDQLRRRNEPVRQLC